jgi:hypothetical protein
MTMVMERRSRSIYLRVLLIALAIQAMTPDIHDLASPFLFEILSVSSDPGVAAFEGMAVDSFVLDHEPPSSGSCAPFRWKLDQPDRLPDEAGLLPGLRAGTIPRRFTGGLVRPWSLPPDRVGPMVSIEQGRRSRTHPGLLPANDLTISLCKLTC